MPTIEVSLPESLQEFVEAEVRSGHYSDSSAYLSQLIQQAWKERERARIKEAILAGLASGESIEMTPERWQQFKDEIRSSRA